MFADVSSTSPAEPRLVSRLPENMGLYVSTVAQS